jgi:uncharacterized protein (TIGR02284 family)
MDSEAAIDNLNGLVHINKDAESGFLTAAANVKNSELESLFTGYAAQHAKFAGELQSEIERLGGSASDSGSLGGALHRGWLDLKSTLSNHSAAGMLAACESAEESAQIAYNAASHATPTGQPHALIEKHKQQIQGIRTRLVRLVKETEDGIDFQKNE